MKEVTNKVAKMQFTMSQIMLFGKYLEKVYHCFCCKSFDQIIQHQIFV